MGRDWQSARRPVATVVSYAAIGLSLAGQGRLGRAAPSRVALGAGSTGRAVAPYQKDAPGARGREDDRTAGPLVDSFHSQFRPASRKGPTRAWRRVRSGPIARQFVRIGKCHHLPVTGDDSRPVFQLQNGNGPTRRNRRVPSPDQARFVPAAERHRLVLPPLRDVGTAYGANRSSCGTVLVKGGGVTNMWWHSAESAIRTANAAPRESVSGLWTHDRGGRRHSEWNSVRLPPPGPGTPLVSPMVRERRSFQVD
jgi:hypothetical protein